MSGGEAEVGERRHTAKSRRGASRLRSAEAKKAEFGSGSIFDAEVKSAERLPFELPVSKYMKEALIGLKGAPHFGSAEERTGQARAIYRRLQRAAFTESALGACECLVWVATGVLFATVSGPALEGLRQRLARSWFLISVELGKTELLGNLAIGRREQVLHCLPTFLVQVVLRLLIDAFPQDQRLLIANVDSLLAKLTSIVHAELVGFPLASKTAMEIRKQLFRRKLLECPEMNSMEAIQRVRRFTVMESAQGQKSLAFGELGGSRLEEMQLEHVMEDRHRRKDEGRKRTAVQEDLLSSRVEKYEQLAMDGEELFLRHMEALYPEAESEEDDRVVTVPQTPARSEQRDSLDTSGRWTAELVQGQEVRETVQLGRSRRSLSITATTVNATTTVRLQREREKREGEAQERKRRDDLVLARLAEPLGEAYQPRPAERTMVSPVISRQLGALPDASLQTKTRSGLRRPAGAGDSPTARVAASESLPQLPGVAPTAAASLAAATATGLAVAAMGKSEGMRAWRFRKRCTIFDSRGGGFTMEPLARNQAGVPIELTGQQHLEHAEVLRRLQQQREANERASFDVYAKEHDLQTGLRKQRLDGGKIEQQESVYVDSLEKLVGSRSEPALRMPRHRLARPGGGAVDTAAF